MQENRIICGDCVQVMDSLPAETVRLVVADPPYFNVLLGENWDTSWKTPDDYLLWTQRWMRSAMRLLVPGGLLYCFGQVGKREHVMLHLMSQAAIEYSFHDLLIWDRVVGYNDRRDSWTPAYEMAIVLRKDGAPPLFNKDAVRETYDAKTIEQYLKDKRYKDLDARRAHLERGKYATNLWRIPSLKGSSKEENRPSVAKTVVAHRTHCFVQQRARRNRPRSVFGKRHDSRRRAKNTVAAGSESSRPNIFATSRANVWPHLKNLKRHRMIDEPESVALASTKFRFASWPKTPSLQCSHRA